MKSTCQITVRGKAHTWSFSFPADPKYIKEWQADGLDVSEVLNTIPQWAQRIGLTHAWCAGQDVWNWMRLW